MKRADCARKYAFAVAGLLAVILFSPRIPVRADGVTVFLHGWNPELADTPAWMAGMRGAIVDEFLGGETNYATITITDDGGLIATCDPWDYDLAAGTTGELLIIVDWVDVADHLTGGPPSEDVAELIVDCLIDDQNGKAPAAELPIHLIGHSRGGGMACEVARQLGEHGIVVDQVTPLDPHPLTSADPQPLPPNPPVIDAPAVIYENIVFADAYNQLDDYPKGEYVDGAYNRMWGNMPGGYHDNAPPDNVYANHRNPVLAYQGTINLANPFDNGEATMDAAERVAWFNDYEEAGANTGFTYARIDGSGDRSSATAPVDGDDEVRDGLHENVLIGGKGAREDLAWAEAVWPNVAVLDVWEDGVELVGDPAPVDVGSILQLRYVYLDFDSGCTVQLHADADRNPYNGNEIWLSTQNHPGATGEAYTENIVDWDTADWDGGETVYVYAKVEDSVRTRYYYAEHMLSLQSPESPSWSGGTGCGVNHPPVPNAGPDQAVCVGEKVLLDGSASYDPDEGIPPNTVMSTVTPKYVYQPREDLRFRWSVAVLYYSAGRAVLAMPEGADVRATMQDYDQEIASFVPTVPGVYQFDLFLTDDFDACLSDRVNITVTDCEVPDGPPEETFAFERFLVSPNPFRTEVNFGFVGEGVPSSIYVQIFDLSGHFVWEGQSAGDDEVTWNGLSSDGKRVASGPYVYKILIDGPAAHLFDTGVVFLSP